MERGAWEVIIYGVAELHMTKQHTHYIYIHIYIYIYIHTHFFTLLILKKVHKSVCVRDEQISV